jgi:hypothetical protein
MRNLSVIKKLADGREENLGISTPSKENRVMDARTLHFGRVLVCAALFGMLALESAALTDEITALGENYRASAVNRAGQVTGWTENEDGEVFRLSL